MTLSSSIRRFLGPVLLFSTLLVWGGCEDGALNAPDIRDGAEQDTALFGSYVALGNSITAGFQSSGINRSTQEASFAAILADSMNTPFGIPALAVPGCPPPLTRFFNDEGVPAPQRPPETSEETCALRESQTPRQLNNVAVPGARVIDALSNTGPRSAPSPLTQFILGGRTQVEAALDANPTFATIWLGNNNVLGPALAGTTDDLTPFSRFARDYTQVLGDITSSPSFQGGVLVGVANVTFLPFFSPGPVYAALEQQGEFPPNFTVASSCAQSTNGLSARVPVSYGFTLIGRARANPNQTVTLDCGASGTPVLTLNDVESIVQTVRQYNGFIRDAAQRRGLAFFNPNEVLRALYTNDDGDRDPTNDLIPKFPNRAPDAPPFGQFFSLDGVHPSATTHRVMAAQLIEVINNTYDTSLSPPENVPEVPSSSQ
jgi:hypothetical protein